MEIRDCAIEDTDEICLLLVELNEALGEDMEIDRRTVESNLKEMLGEKSNYLNLAACEGGRITGFISVVFYKSVYHKVGTALINELIVGMKNRGKGIGRALLERVIAEARNRNMDEIEVGVMKENLKAVQFYKLNGLTDEYLILGREFDD